MFSRALCEPTAQDVVSRLVPRMEFSLSSQKLCSPTNVSSWPPPTVPPGCAAEIPHRLHLPTAHVNPCFSPEGLGLVTHTLGTLRSDRACHGLWPGSSWDGRVVLTPDHLVIRG